MGEIFLHFPNRERVFLPIGAINLRGGISLWIFVNAMEKTLITDRKTVYEKPEVKSFDLSMEQAILDASPEFNSFNPEEIW
jgi:hypothetical protein